MQIGHQAASFVERLQAISRVNSSLVSRMLRFNSSTETKLLRGLNGAEVAATRHTLSSDLQTFHQIEVREDDHEQRTNDCQAAFPLKSVITYNVDCCQVWPPAFVCSQRCRRLVAARAL
eukprot:TRINITY_DN11227_c0_g1_i2.p1 TRINITY_DN11227_c0_g1~~TRINITY_DN11227_c0_g1_i2.p1  ORF type:complete len:119 (-),score=9.94 TRINITY_DN11227_c0_g1_i2:244-600(-)